MVPLRGTCLFKSPTGLIIPQRRGKLKTTTDRVTMTISGIYLTRHPLRLLHDHLFVELYLLDDGTDCSIIFSERLCTSRSRVDRKKRVDDRSCSDDDPGSTSVPEYLCP